mmetsp:Transcript_49533/g.112443  ORF Transcript_49533/g.112443 Transcript_49533/m.112443 type:complete len:279 (-) Transcript_49533:22-858(-)
MSSGVVSLMLVYSPAVSFTGRPSCSMIDTSSVTCQLSSFAFLKPSRRRLGLITCGVCTSQSKDLSTVLTTNSPSGVASLTVAFMGTPSTAAPCSIASLSTLKISAGVTSGRAASWMQTKGASAWEASSPLDTESWRSFPGSAKTSLAPLGAESARPLKSSRYSGATTSTTSLTPSNPRKSSRVCMSTGFPRSSRNCLGIPAFMRDPTPPARRITEKSLTGLSRAMLGVEKERGEGALVCGLPKSRSPLGLVHAVAPQARRANATKRSMAKRKLDQRPR